MVNLLLTRIELIIFVKFIYLFTMFKRVCSLLKYIHPLTMIVHGKNMDKLDSVKIKFSVTRVLLGIPCDDSLMVDELVKKNVFEGNLNRLRQSIELIGP